MDFRSQKSINIKSCHANFEGKTASECIFCEFSTFVFLPLKANHEIWFEGSFGNFFSNTLTLIVENDFKE